MSFGENILKYKDDILKDLATLVELESVADYNPDDCKKALEFVLKRAQEFGLVTKSVEDKAGHAELGNGEKLCGVLTHLDVVPKGNNWTMQPFELTRKNGRLYGRGVADDKGAAIVTLYCLKALKDSGIDGENRIRAIFGTSEENGMEDMDLYFKSEAMPDMSFTPDSNYGICRCEKGILQLEIYADTHNGTVLTEFHSGKAVNAVPDTAYAMLDCTETEDQRLLRLADASDGDFEFHYTIDGLMVLSRGKAAHACEVQNGFNAATALVNLLSHNFTYDSLGSICTFLNCRINNEINGNSLGIKMRDSSSGQLTVNVGTVHITDSYATATLDVRYPVTMDGKRILSRIIFAAMQEGLHVKTINHSTPLVIDEDSRLIGILSQAYENVTGEKPQIYSTGGGTYARKLGGKGVAFGPVFPDDKCNMHNADESLDEEKFFKHAQICLEAMYKLFTEKL